MSDHYCSFVPPFVLDKLEDSVGLPVEDAEIANATREARADAIAEVTPTAGEGPVPVAPTATGTSRREVYDSQTTTNKQHVLVRAEGDPATADQHVTDAYNHAGTVRSFLGEVLGRESLDNRGLDQILNVHYGNKYNNAFWDGSQMTFGDGDGVIFSGFVRSLEVVAHELGHGVTQYTAGLEYKRQSGALNEHFSDVLGTAITQWAEGQSPIDADWLVGDEIMGPSLYGEALRSMAHPGEAYDNDLIGKDPQRAHMDNLYKGNGDNGGVHINSGIPNRAFYLTAMELDDTMVATRIWYHALQNLGPKTTFAQGAKQVAESARNLVHAGEAPLGAPQAVRGAFNEVGL